MKIYKYNLTDGDVDAPIVQILDIQMQDGTPVMWCLVSEGARQRHIEVRYFYTGEEMDPETLREFDYFRTLQDGDIVYHVFIKN